MIKANSIKIFAVALKAYRNMKIAYSKHKKGCDCAFCDNYEEAHGGISEIK